MLRYYNFDEKRSQIFDGIITNNFTGDSLVSQPGAAKANGVAPRFIASYKVSDGLTLNALASQGFRLGGINDPLNVTLCTPADRAIYSGQPTFEDEKVLNYEIGAKTRLADGRVTFNAAVFYSDIDNLQVIADAGSCSSRIVLNAQGRSQGAEMELRV